MCCRYCKKKHDHAWPHFPATMQWQPHPASMSSCIYVKEPGFLQGPHGRISAFAPWVSKLSIDNLPPPPCNVLQRWVLQHQQEHHIGLTAASHALWRDYICYLHEAQSMWGSFLFSFTVANHVPQPVPSVIKAHFSWNWQCTTLNCGDELINLLLSFAYLTIQHLMAGAVVSVNIFLVFCLFIMKQRFQSLESIATCFVYFVSSH